MRSYVVILTAMKMVEQFWFQRKKNLNLPLQFGSFIVCFSIIYPEYLAISK
jgi:hypothetical protein